MSFNLIKLRRTLRRQKQSETDWYLRRLRKYKSLDLMNYYWKFIFNYTKIVKSLMCLTCKDKKWCWKEKQKNVFCTLKKSKVTVESGWA